MACAIMASHLRWRAPVAWQATSMTSLLFLVVAILAIAASVFMFVRYRESRRELEEMRKGGSGAT